MKKRSILWMAAAAALTLSACNYDLEQNSDCKDGEKKCVNNAVLTCEGGAWKKTEECGAKTCNAATHICEVIACKTDEKRCNGNDVEICVDSAWTIDVQCGADETCNAATHMCEVIACQNDEKRCNGKTIEFCVDNAWKEVANCGDLLCDNETFSCVMPECEATRQRCHENNVEICADGKWTIETECEGEAAYCLADAEAHTASCVECFTHAHCASENSDSVKAKFCDMKTNLCIPKPTIASCQSLSLFSSTQTSSGLVLDPRATKDASTIKATLHCGQAGQKLDEYTEIKGERNTDYLADDGKFEYIATLDDLASGTYLCLWSFTLEGEVPVFCPIGEGELSYDADMVPVISETLIYTLEWDQHIDFENGFSINNAYNKSASGIIIPTNLTINYYGGIFEQKEEDGKGSIEGNSLVFSSKQEKDKGNNYIEVTLDSKNNYIGKLAFDYKGWDDDSFNKHEVVIELIGETNAEHKAELTGRIKTRRTETLYINQTVDKFRISMTKPAGHSEDKPRLVIDNIRWTNHKP